MCAIGVRNNFYGTYGRRLLFDLTQRRNGQQGVSSVSPLSSAWEVGRDKLGRNCQEGPRVHATSGW